MRKSLFLLFIFLTMWSCKNEEDNVPGGNISLGITPDYVKLSSANSQEAGVLQFYANESEVDVTWISLADCNLDTTQTKVILKDGKGILPIRWFSKQANGAYAPELTAFKAWVMIKGDNYLKNVSLVWSDYIDASILSRSVQTRADGAGAPKASLIQFGPSEVIMDEMDGGWTYARIQNIKTLNLDYTQITTAMNVDLRNAPTSIAESQELSYPWLGTAPADGFTALVAASAPNEGYASSFTLKYKDGGIATGGLTFVNSTLPQGNIPAMGGTYDFNFTGEDYTGSVQVNAFDISGNVLATGSKTLTKTSKIVIPTNVDEARTIIFKYKIDGSENWLELPNTTIKVQNGQGTTPPTPGDVPSYTPITPSGDIPDGGGIYSTIFSNYEGTVEFRAVRENGKELASTSVEVTAAVSKQASLEIPEAMSVSDNKVIFQYRINDGEWTTMETRKQLFETFTSGSIEGLPGVIPKSGGTYYYGSGGSLSARLTIYVKDDTRTLYQNSGAVGDKIRVVIPANTTGKPRELFFWYERSDQPGKLKLIQRGSQAGA